MPAGERPQRRRIVEAGRGGDRAIDDSGERRPFELGAAPLERVAAVAFLVRPLAQRQVRGRSRRRGGPAAGRQRGGGGRAREKSQLALPVLTTMIRLVPDSGR